MDIEVGALADWVTGLATVALAAVTLKGLRTQQRDMKRQQEQLSDQQEQLNEQRELTRRQTELITSQLHAARRAQAQRVTTSEETLGWTVTNLPDEIHGNGYVIRVRNTSDRPVYDVTCVIPIRGDGVEKLMQPEFVGRQALHGVARVVQPALDSRGHLTRTHAILRGTDEPLDFVFVQKPPVARYVVEFTDASNVRWQLSADDRLTEVPQRARVAPQRQAADETSEAEGAGAEG